MSWDKLAVIIANVKESVSRGCLTSKVATAWTKELALIGFEYDYAAFPKLEKTEFFSDNIGDSPRNLAEALLWKLGKWKSYKKFVSQYSDENSIPTNTDVVFFAFAKHLKNPDNPIYDQHALRAMWAICENFTSVEKAKCKKLLMNTKEKWKESGAGNSAVDCYQIYLKYMNEIVSAGATKREIDLLLMPLGQAIKKSTNCYSEFCKLCDC